ncbi:MAG: T9SS type A sorting domain-containing protein [Crocinitomicaceae bacterium]|nr:T9SS type A sorting domain-containing protein [Flavobacteriales bacterium]NQZ36229.1 T9SS type A sorting domain-containing protein [Crocinitomicaceae bacterium]
MKKHMKSVILGLSLVAVSAEFNVSAQCIGSWETSPDYYIAWQDEFNYSSTSDPGFISNWTVVNKDDNWGTEYFRPEQVTVQNGALRLTALKQGITGSDGKWKHYKSGAVRSKAHIDSKINSWEAEGFYYGVLEFNARIPSGNIDVSDLWPALWTFSGGGTEIDLVDGSKNGKSIVSNLIDWKYAPSQWSPYWTIVNFTPSSYTVFNHNVVYASNAYVEWHGVYFQNTSGGNIEAKAHGIVVDQDVWNTGETFSDGYNRFAVSWEPDKVTFYINGREIMTANDVPTRKKTSTIIMSLQSGWGGTPSGGTGTMIPTDYMEIDYVRLYRPVGHNHTVSPYPAYKSVNEYMFTNISENYSFPKVHAEPNSIVADKNNPNIVYYRGTDNKLYVSEKAGSGTWSVSELAPGYSWPSWTQVKGDLIFSEGKIIYKGMTNRLQLFWKSGGNWTHGTIDDNWSSWDHYVSDQPGSICATSQGKILFRGWDNKMHMFSWESGSNDWVGTRLPHNYASGEYINGDVISGGSSQVYYRGVDGKVQNFWMSGSTYYHGNIGAHGVKNNPSSMALTSSDQIYFIGTDNRLHKYYWNSGWQHELLESTSGSSLYSVSNWNFGYLKSAYAYSSIKVDISDPTKNTVVYFGEDGRLQQMKKVGVSWTHKWIDDYSNTDFHASYPNQTYGVGYASVAVTSDGKIVYDQYGKNLSCFEYGNCEYLNPTSNIGILKSAVNSDISIQEVKEEVTLSLFPNPARELVHISAEGKKISQIKIIDLTGKVIKEIAIDQSENADVRVNTFAPGMYTVIVHLSDGSISTDKLIIK